MLIRYAVEEQPLGTAGALVHARAILGDTFLVMNGNTYFNTSLAALVTTHALGDTLATMALVQVTDVSRYGAVALNEEGYVTQFIEKGLRGPGKINAGLYLLSSSVLETFPAAIPLSLETNVFPKLALSRHLEGCMLQGYHIDIGTPESYAEFNHTQQWLGQR